jgi:cytochrome P450
MLTQDDTYEGYSIPAGTMLFANTWAIHHDESEYERPDDFYPERFLNNKFGTHHPTSDTSDDHRRATYGFGAGRRVCPGQRLAENSLVSALPFTSCNGFRLLIRSFQLDGQYGKNCVGV